MAYVSAFQRELEAAGFQVINKIDRWYEVITPHGEPAVAYKQNAHAYHVFGLTEWTASGCTAATSHTGGLGDALGTDGEVRSYERIVLRAPSKLLRKYDGLYRASSGVFNS